MVETSAVDVAFRFVECINRQDLDALTGLMSANHKFVDLSGSVEKGQERMREGWAEYFRLCPAYMIHVGQVYQVGDSIVLVGRTTGSHLGLPRLEEFRDPVIWTARVADGLVTEWRLYPVAPDVLAALGASGETRLV